MAEIPFTELIEAEELANTGRYNEAIKLLKRLVETSNIEGKMFAAARLAVTIIESFNDYPSPGSPAYIELYKYLKITFELYDQADDHIREIFQESVSLEILGEFFKLTQNGDSLDAPVTKTHKMIVQSQSLCEMGKYREAIETLKSVIEETDSNYEIMFCASLIGSIIVHYILKDTPYRNTQEYDEAYKYLKLAIETYENSDLLDQQLFYKAQDINGVKDTLAQMERRESLIPKSKCFIATAVYGSPFTPEVKGLQQFRDDVLLKSSLGIVVVHLYYLLSPPLAFLISKSKTLQVMTKFILLEPVLHLLKKRYQILPDNKIISNS